MTFVYKTLKNNSEMLKLLPFIKAITQGIASLAEAPYPSIVLYICLKSGGHVLKVLSAIQI